MVLRELVFDVETTGLNPLGGDKIIEIAFVELINKEISGKELHFYINPLRDIPESSFRIHGLSGEFLQDKPIFKDCAKEIINFIGDSELIAHNSDFDMNFLNKELTEAGFKTIAEDRFVDTLKIAKSKYPNLKYSLDNLAKKFNISLEKREKHGALIDSVILAKVYIKMMVEEVFLDSILQNNVDIDIFQTRRQNFTKRDFILSPEIKQKHQEFLKKSITNPIWNKIKQN